MATAAKGKTRFEWTMERKVAVLTEVAAAGEAAFKTFKDGVAADGDARTQKEVWTHESDGILSLAKKHYSLHGTTFPAYGSVIASVKGWVQAGAHLYTPGKEQGEPVEYDDPEEVSNTKSETPLTEYEQLIIEVSELMKSAMESAAKRKSEREANKVANAAQDEAAKKTYKKLSEEELKAAQHAGSGCNENMEGTESACSNDDKLPDRIELEFYLSNYMEEEPGEGLTVNELMNDETKWPAGFALNGPDFDGKYYFARLDNGNSRAMKGKKAGMAHKAGQARESMQEMLRMHQEEMRTFAACEAANALREEAHAKREDALLSLRVREFEHRERMEKEAMERDKERALLEEMRAQREAVREDARIRREEEAERERKLRKDEKAKREDARDERQSQLMSCMMQLVEKALAK
mmetsp:Transcript_112417/g.155251  ORF Transcript_112417/g.155251 Transcript_112417/m.155251 type:complete len:409 (+) Transcript_112417:3-1229(+)